MVNDLEDGGFILLDDVAVNYIHNTNLYNNLLNVL
jgi:hypothetical protein